MSRVLLVTILAFTFTGCDKATQKPAPAEARPAAVAPVKAAAEHPPAMLSVDGKEMPLGSVLAWDLKIAGSLVPHLFFYADEVGCSDRVTHLGTRLYSAGMIPEGFAVKTHTTSAIWTFTGKPDMVPLAPATVTFVKSTADEVEGIADNTSKLCSLQTDCKTDADCGDGQSCYTEFGVCTVPCPFSLEGKFVAKRCPVYDSSEN